MPGGRPSDYKPEYCQMLIEHMAKGLGMQSFAGEIGVGRRTLYLWIDTHQEFKEAHEEGKAKQLLWYEKNLIGHISGTIKGNVVGLIFGLKNIAPDIYTDRQVIEQTAKVEHTGDKINVSMFSSDTLQLMMRDYQKAKEVGK